MAKRIKSVIESLTQVDEGWVLVRINVYRVEGKAEEHVLSDQIAVRDEADIDKAIRARAAFWEREYLEEPVKSELVGQERTHRRR